MFAFYQARSQLTRREGPPPLAFSSASARTRARKQDLENELERFLALDSKTCHHNLVLRRASCKPLFAAFMPRRCLAVTSTR
ncbi:unnamed protein product [Sphagnum jensenii]